MNVQCPCNVNEILDIFVFTIIYFNKCSFSKVTFQSWLKYLKTKCCINMDEKIEKGQKLSARTQKCLFLLLVWCLQVCLLLEPPRSSMATSTLQLEATLMILAQGFFVINHVVNKCIAYNNCIIINTAFRL